jgi:branched-subunit amino acid ABC-type transport system permease component
MTDYILFLLLGIGTGAVYAALATGLVLVYRGSGIVNFAQGAIAMYVAYIFAALRESGDLVVAIPGLPKRISLASEGMAVLPAMVIALVAALVLGALIYQLVFRPLRHAPNLAKIVATIGLTLVLQAVVVLRFGADPVAVGPILPSGPLDLLGITIPADRLWLAGLVVLSAAALALVFRLTRFGLATRAAAENEKGALLLGYSPDRLAVVNWMLASAVAGMGGILIAPISGLNAVDYTLFVIPALGAAVLARFTSFGIAAGAALAIGMAQSELLKLQTTWPWLVGSGVKDALPFVVIIVALVIRGNALPTRANAGEGRLPASRPARRILLGAVAATLAALVALQVLDATYRLALITSIVAAIMCLGFVVLTGYVGQVSLGQMTLAGVAGFALSLLTTHANVPFPLAPLLAAAGAGLLGALVGLPALRVRGSQLAVATIAASVAIDKLIFSNVHLVGGVHGSTVAQPTIGALNLGIAAPGTSFPNRAFGILALIVLVACALLVANLRRGAVGRRLIAVRENERGAAALGVNVGFTKVASFAAASAIAGLGGALLAYQQAKLSYQSFGVFPSLYLLAIAYLGGITTVGGALVAGSLATGGLVFTAADDWFGLGDYQLLIGGLGLILTAIFNPEGIAGAARARLARLGASRRQLRRPAPAAEEAA